MNYLALGDSMSIDQYTGIKGGGAVSQFARLLQVETIEDLAIDGCTTTGVLQALKDVTIQPNPAKPEPKSLRSIVTVKKMSSGCELYGCRVRSFIF